MNIQQLIEGRYREVLPPINHYDPNIILCIINDPPEDPLAILNIIHLHCYVYVYDYKKIQYTPTLDRTMKMRWRIPAEIIKIPPRIRSKYKSQFYARWQEFPL